MSDTQSTISETSEAREDLFVTALPASLVKHVRVVAAMRGMRINGLVELALRSYFPDFEPERNNV